MATDRTLPLGQIVDATHVTLDGFSITVLAGPDAGKTLVASESEISIGTDPSNALVLGDNRVSRHHCSVTATPTGLRLVDLGSRNGTWVDRVRVESGFVDRGATVSVGRSVLRLDQGESAIRVPLSADDRFGRLLGSSSSMRKIFAALGRVAASDTTVLVEGETGTGKGMLAAAIHDASPRAKKPFVVLDCTAIPPTLVESELFGHVAGSFTGATTARAGAFEQAQGGTIFIDEIGELPTDIQPKLLRALEERTVKPVGGSRTVKLDVRVIAATNRDLRVEVNRGTFRSDLFYRLNVVRLTVPPLRERRDDIVLLAKHFLEELAPGKPLSPELLASLVRQPWPGNVRELRGAIERALLLEDLALAGLDDPQAHRATHVENPAAPAATSFDPLVPFRDAKAAAIAAWEGRYVRELMRHAEGNLSKASRVVQMDRSYLRELLKKHGEAGE